MAIYKWHKSLPWIDNRWKGQKQYNENGSDPGAVSYGLDFSSNWLDFFKPPVYGYLRWKPLVFQRCSSLNICRVYLCQLSSQHPYACIHGNNMGSFAREVAWWESMFDLKISDFPTMDPAVISGDLMWYDVIQYANSNEHFRHATRWCPMVRQVGL